MTGFGAAAIIPFAYDAAARLMRAVKQILATTLVAIVGVGGCQANAVDSGEFGPPVEVAIIGYNGHAMEPFIARDDSVLLFNDLNHPSVDTDLHWAERIGPDRFRYRGRIDGANSELLDGVPSMDMQRMLYFVSVRNYRETFSTIHRAQFENGVARNVERVDGVSRRQLGQVNFDAEISADGDTLFAVDGTFAGGPMPRTADIFIARRIDERFERQENSAAIMRSINTPALEYAPAISADGLELFFTRLSGALFWRRLEILHATRTSTSAPFGPPARIETISGFVEAPTISSDGRTLYFHKKVDGRHRIFRVTRR